MTEPDPRQDPNHATGDSVDPAMNPAVSPTATDVRRRRARREHDAQDEVPHSSVARSHPERAARALVNALACARIADDNRAKDVLLLDLRKATALVDFFVIATATSRRQVNAIAEEVDQEMKRQGERKLGLEGAEEGKWVLIDYGDFVVHIFSPETRAFYALEDVWGDADRIDWREPTQTPTPETPDPQA
ncbi:MAG: ribosome silencing factor [Isosphaeraceae bacterium]